MGMWNYHSKLLKTNTSKLMWQNQNNYIAVTVIDGLKRPLVFGSINPYNQTNYIPEL